MSYEPFYRLVKLVGRAFYDDVLTKADAQPKAGRGDNRGMAVVVLDALTRKQWVREDDLAKSLKLHAKQLRRTLRIFEEEKLVCRDNRKETAKGAKNFNAALAATGDEQVTKEGADKLKLHTHSYCCIDYAQIYDVVRYRIHRMKKKLKDELDSRNTIQEYICPTPNCGRRYSALDALQLISFSDEYFHCESCNGELVAESDKLAAEEMGDGDENARRRRRDKLKTMLQKMEEQLKPLQQQLARVKDLPVPEFGTLQDWELRAHTSARANGDSNLNDSSKTSQGQIYGGTPMPYFGETKVEVALSGLEAKEENTEDIKPTTMKVLPPWMIKESMNLTKEQRGEVKTESKMDEKPILVDEKKPNLGEQDEKNVQAEFIKAYYAAIAQRQEEQEAAERTQQESVEGSTSNIINGIAQDPVRRVGMKAKREDDNDDVEWEETPPAGTTAPAYKLVADLNVEANAFEDDEDDEIDWEDG